MYKPNPGRVIARVGLPDENGCKNWTGYIESNGYGRVKYKGKMWRAHRLVWTLAKGDIPGGLCVLHSCDNRACVNVQHLRLGTEMDNAHDCASKGRTVKGEGHYLAKLTADKIPDIFYCSKNGMTQRDIAGIFGVTQTAIMQVLSRKTWKHVPVPDEVPF